tara:strand:+ start:4632 stop:5345 length:714 start_codon:yes stop_codon:yes gene_type:complete
MGLRENDLKHMLHNVFEIDSFKSKMGDDEDIVTLSFSLRDKAPADDLVKFLEGGYSFILDADATAGEQSDGSYKVFVELERNRHVHEHIYEVLDGVKKISGIDDLKFRYYKNFKSKDATMENLDIHIPKDPNNYGMTRNQTTMENYKNFFNNSYIDSVDLLENNLTIKKSYADPIIFEFVDFGDRNKILKNINQGFNVDAVPEILFLTKYLGDYNISKYGDNLVFENEGLALVVKRK